MQHGCVSVEKMMHVACKRNTIQFATPNHQGIMQPDNIPPHKEHI